MLNSIDTGSQVRNWPLQFGCMYCFWHLCDNRFDRFVHCSGLKPTKKFFLLTDFRKINYASGSKCKFFLDLNQAWSIIRYPNMMKVKELKGHTARVLHMAASPNGSTVVSAAAEWVCFVFRSNISSDVTPHHFVKWNIAVLGHFRSSFKAGQKRQLGLEQQIHEQHAHQVMCCCCTDWAFTVSKVGHAFFPGQLIAYFCVCS